VTAPVGVNGLTLTAAGQVLDADFSAGETYTFANGVGVFEVRNIHPAIDAASSTVTTALPLKLSFSASQMITSMTWDSLPSAVPEADVYMMLIAGLGVLGFLKRRR
jgi:hypothetical protein